MHEKGNKPQPKKDTTRYITLVAVGIALFVVLSLCLLTPVFENYYLCLGYAVMAVYLYHFGVTAGTIVGALGVVMYCLLINGLRGMPGWAVGNIALGIILGLAVKATKRMPNKKSAHFIDVLAVVVATAVGILLMKSTVETAIYAQPIIVRMGRNFYGFVADVVMLLVSLPLCTILAKPAEAISKKIYAQTATSEK